MQWIVYFRCIVLVNLSKKYIKSNLISKMAFDLLKPQFAYSKAVFAFSFQCFPQAKEALTYSNPGLLSHFGVFRKQKKL